MMKIALPRIRGREQGIDLFVIEPPVYAVQTAEGVAEEDLCVFCRAARGTELRIWNTESGKERTGRVCVTCAKSFRTEEENRR